jgi:VanW like protein
MKNMRVAIANPHVFFIVIVYVVVFTLLFHSFMLRFLQYLWIASIGISIAMMIPFWSLYAPSTWEGNVAVAQDDPGIRISPVILNKMLQKNGTSESFSMALRRILISKMISDWFSGFAIKYPEYSLILWDQWWFTGTGNSNPGLDQLDFWIKKNFIPKSWLSEYTFEESVFLPKNLYSTWNGIELFQSADDLKQLGYDVVSYRSRVNTDKAYRRENIQTAFAFFGPIRVINPGEVVSYYKNIWYDPTAKKNYKDGLIIKEDKEIKEYGWGICGGSTAIYQGMVTNTSLQRLQVRNHSKRYHGMYSAVINGTKITTPGVDSTVYDGSPDLVFKNVSRHPMLVISNFNGGYGSMESNFTLGFPDDEGSLEYIWSEPKDFVIEGKKRKGKCFTWKINGVEKKSCYNQLK